MVLNYRATNYIGWPLPAFIALSNYATKLQKISETTKPFSNFFQENFTEETVLAPRW
jgi:hypothetical protein